MIFINIEYILYYQNIGVKNMKTNLTLSLEPSVIAKARRISKRRNTSISAMFSNFIILLEDESSFEQEMPPVTRRVLEMGAKLP